MTDSPPFAELDGHRLETLLARREHSQLWIARSRSGARRALKLHEAGVGERGGLRELRTLGMRHPSLAACVAAGRIPGDERLYTLTDYVQGVPLGPEALGPQIRDAAGAAELLAAQLLSALDALHRGGLLHRDLKAENVQLDAATGRPVILDFGLCCGVGDAEDASLVGTPAAFAPELFGGASASVASDLWAAGQLLAEALAGEQLFQRGSPEQMRSERSQFNSLPRAFSERIPSRELVRLLERLLDPDPDKRPQGAEAALFALSLDDTAPGAALERRQCLARWSVAFALSDPRRASVIDAARNRRVLVRLLDRADDAPRLARTRLLDAFAPASARDTDLARILRLSAGAPTPDAARLAELCARLARHGPFTASLPCAREGTLAQELAGALAEVVGVRVEVDPLPSVAPLVRAMSSALGEQPVLTERLERAAPEEWDGFHDAVSELLPAGVLRAVRGGARLDESRLAADWPEFVAEDPAQEQSASERALLGVLAMAPRPLGEEELMRVLGVGLGGELEALAATGFVEGGDAGSGRRWRVSSARLARRLRAHLGASCPARRRLVSVLSAELAEEIDAETAEALAAVMLGEVDGQDDPAFTAMLRRVVHTLRRLGRLELASALVERGLAGLPSGDEASRDTLELEAIDLAMRRGDDAAAEQLVVNAEERGSPHAGFLVRRARLEAHADRRDAALALLESPALDDADLETVVLALQLRAEVRRDLGDDIGALSDLREGLRRCGARPQRRSMVLLERLGGVLLRLGRHDEAVQTYERCLAMVRELGHDALIWSPMNNLARALQDRGERQRGLALQEQAAELCELAGDRRNLFNLVSSLGERWGQIGHLDRARVHLTRALQLAREIGSPSLEGLALHAVGVTRLAEGRHAEAEACFEDALRCRAADADLAGQASVLLSRASARHQRGESAAARVDFERAQGLLSAKAAPRPSLACTLLEARLAWADGDEVATISAAERALSTAQQLRIQRAQWEARDLLARAGGRDLEDLDPAESEPTPWLARLLGTRAEQRALNGQWDDAAEDFALALTLFGETPDGAQEAECLVLRLQVDLDRVDGLLGQDVPDYEAIGDILSRVPRDLERATELVELHELEPLRSRAAELRAHHEDLEATEDMAGLSSLTSKLRDLERLVEINKLLNSERDTQKLLELIVDSAVALTGAARGFLILFDGPSEEFRAARNIDASSIQHPEFQISHSVARRVAREGRALLTANALDDPSLGSTASISELKLLSILCVPLVSRSGSLGAIYLDHPQVVGRFTELHLETVTALAEQASIALENARLSEGLANSNTELTSSREEVRRLNEALQERLQKREAELERTRESLDASRRILGLRYDYSNIVTRSPRMHEALDMLDRITETDYPVVIHGESGTGKELMARACHYNGPRKDQNFLSLNCSAISEQLIESELFGNVRGAFTGAQSSRKGLLAQADKGTLFLDEIGDMSLGVQTRILRVLQEGEFIPVGGTEVVKVDVRVLCATHRDLEAMKDTGDFREDLYYRLAVARLTLPPLRDRVGDVGPLFVHFLEQHGGRERALEPEALAQLEAQPWPGNVRELENFVRSLLLFDRDGEQVDAALVRRVLGKAVVPLAGADSSRGGSPAAGSDEVSDLTLKERLLRYERIEVLKALDAAEGNKSAAARGLGVSIRTFYKMLERLGLQGD